MAASLIVLLLLGSVFCEDKLAYLHKKLSIPPDAKAVLIFGQSSHLDWDWLNWFPTNVNNIPPSVISYWGGEVQPTDVIFSRATSYLADSNYGYSVCEMGFLRRFAVDHPDLWANMKKGNLHIVGGGVTSPDNLLPHGEAFIRDYLVGLSWVKSQNITWGRKVWLPDDFGHDSQLPVVLQAMGVKAASFSRVPGACNQGRNPTAQGVVSAHQILLDANTGGLDFWWTANDGSTTYTYYQPNHYCCGDGLYSSSSEPNSPSHQASCSAVHVGSITDRINAYIGVRDPLRKTPYMFVATGCDFKVPLANLVTTLTQWNTDEYPKNGVYAISGSFDDYADMVLEYLKQNGDTLHKRNFHGVSPDTSFKPTPYWMGFYSSRVSNKQLHFETVKRLVGAETFLAIAQWNGIPTKITNAMLKSTWNLTSPSTHHDFITGTATDYVYLGEQLPLLQSVYSQGNSALNQIFADLVLGLSSTDSAGAEAPVWVAFNQLGFPRSGIAAIKLGAVGAQENLLKNYFVEKYPQSMQIAQNGDLISVFSAPSLGYSTQPAEAGYSLGELRVSRTDVDFSLENALVKAVVSQSANWAITSIVDKVTGNTAYSLVNSLEFRSDNGNIYRYGFEEGCGFDKLTPTIVALPGQIVENGPVRVTVLTGLRVTFSSGTSEFWISYSLGVGDAKVEIRVSGAAPANVILLTKVQFASQVISEYSHGTPYHWDHKTPQPYGLQNDFSLTIEATHDFILPSNSQGHILGAVYHNSTPGWGVTTDGTTLYGVLLRNSPSGCAGKGAEGSDSASHNVSFAVRIPTGISGAESGQALKEARAFHTPLQAYFVQSPSFSKLPATFSLASVVSPSTALITVAKPGEYDGNSVVFRVYYPENVPKEITLQLAGVFSPSSNDALIATALEEPTGQKATWTGNSISYKPNGALSTIQIARS